jgi:outer membrane protein assembly factor BamB
VSDQGGPIAPGFGSIWAADPQGSRVVRVALGGGVSASIPIRAPRLVSLSAGAGAVWALTDDELVRIDPATNRIAAHIPLPPPSGNALDVIAGQGVMWVGTGSQLLRIDAARNVIDRRISTEHNGLAALSLASDGRTMYLLQRDRRLVGLDARTGKQLSVSHPDVEGVWLTSAGDTVAFATQTAVTAVDGPSGRPLWRRNLGARKLNGTVVSRGGLWVQGTPVNGSADQLWRLDRKGRITASLPAPDFGAAGMASAGGALWIMSPAGVLTEIR